MNDAPPTRLKVIAQIGRGRMTEVYLCRLQGPAGFEKEVVVKRLIARLASDPVLRRLFLEEGQRAAPVTHAGIAQVFEVGEDHGIPYIVMEYVRGTRLTTLIENGRNLNRLHYGHAARLVSGICDALHCAHRAVDRDGVPLGLVHGDIRPDNIVISSEGAPKLLGFGLAKAKGRLRETHFELLAQDPRYSAPEQVAGTRVDQRLDVYGLGLLLYELTTGRNPYRREGRSDAAIFGDIMNGVFPRPRERVANYPPELEDIVLAALEREPDKRCRTVASLQERLGAFMGRKEYGSKQKALKSWLAELGGGAAPPEVKTTEDPAIWGAQVGDELYTTMVMPILSAASAPLPAVSAPAAAAITAPGSSSVTNLSKSDVPTRRRPGPARQVAWKPWAAIAGITVLAGALGFGLRQTQNEGGNPAVGTVAVARPDTEAPDDAEAKTYLDAAEAFASELRFANAQDMIGKASRLQIRNPNLHLRLVRLRDRVETEIQLKNASGHLARKQWPEATKAASAVLAVDPEHAGARAILAQARGGGKAGGVQPLALAKGVGAGAPVAPPPAAAAPPVAPPSELPAILPSGPAPAVVMAPEPSGARKSRGKLRRGNKRQLALAGAAGDARAGSVASKAPPPTLPRTFFPESPERVARVCAAVEQALVSLAGISVDYARAATAQLRREALPGVPLYPIGMYHFIAREAALERDAATAGANLAAAQSSGRILKFKNLPGRDERL